MLLRQWTHFCILCLVLTNTLLDINFIVRRLRVSSVQLTFESWLVRSNACSCCGTASDDVKALPWMSVSRCAISWASWCWLLLMPKPVECMNLLIVQYPACLQQSEKMLLNVAEEVIVLFLIILNYLCMCRLKQT